MRFQAVSTAPEAVALWNERQAELTDYLFVLSMPGEPNLPWRARTDFSGGGYLRSLFAHDRLWFASHEIFGDMFGSAGQARLTLDYTIGLDSNAAQYLVDLVAERTTPMGERFRADLQSLARYQFNWEQMPALLERADALQAGRDLDRIWEVVHAAEYFGACDLAYFAERGVLRLTESAETVQARTQANLTHFAHLTAGAAHADMMRTHRLFQVLLLKIAALHHLRPSPRDADRNLGELLDFMCGEVGLSLPWVLSTAAGLFEQGGAFAPLRKLTTPKNKWFESTRNIAWDVFHYCQRRMMLGPNGREGAFLLPFTFTYDRGLAEWFDLQAQRSCLRHRNDAMPQFFAARDHEQEFADRYPADGYLHAAARRHLDPEGYLRRAERMRKAPPDLDALLSSLSS